MHPHLKHWLGITMTIVIVLGVAMFTHVISAQTNSEEENTNSANSASCGRKINVDGVIEVFGRRLSTSTLLTNPVELKSDSDTFSGVERERMTAAGITYQALCKLTIAPEEKGVATQLGLPAWRGHTSLTILYQELNTDASRTFDAYKDEMSWGRDITEGVDQNGNKYFWILSPSDRTYTTYKGNTLIRVEMFYFHMFNNDQLEAIREIEMPKAEAVARYLISSAEGGAENPHTDKIIIESFEPRTVTAGIKDSYDEVNGTVTYGVREDNFILRGKNLTGATISSPHSTVNGGNDGIEFDNITISEDGTEMRGTMITYPNAEEGTAPIIIRAADGSEVNTEVQVMITGTQHLKRRFSEVNYGYIDSLNFYGDWPQLMPNEEILRIDNALINGLTYIAERPKYHELGMVVNIHEDSFWKNVTLPRRCPNLVEDNVCGTDFFFGCAGWRDPAIHISTGNLSQQAAATVYDLIVHEAAHKLHFYYDGKRPDLTPPPNTLSEDWRPLVASSTLQCSYIPITRGCTVTWADGSNQRTPQCGFARAYGAWDVEKGDFYEDIATFVARFLWNPPFTQTEAYTTGTFAPAYDQKRILLDHYGF